MRWGHAPFTLENGAAQLEAAFSSVTLLRTTPSRVLVRDADVVADYVASVGDLYQEQVDRPWEDVVGEVRRQVQATIDEDGAFLTAGDVGAFVCR